MPQKVRCALVHEINMRALIAATIELDQILFISAVAQVHAHAVRSERA
jgi:hypothetical protein